MLLTDGADTRNRFDWREKKAKAKKERKDVVVEGKKKGKMVATTKGNCPWEEKRESFLDETSILLLLLAASCSRQQKNAASFALT